MLKHFLILAAAVSSAVAQVKLETLSPGSQARYTQVLPLPDGGKLLLGVTTGSPMHIALGALGSTAFRLPYPLGGHGNDTPRAAAIDPSGNLWIVGDTDSDDFALVNPIVAQKVPYRTAGFVLEIDPRAGELLFATYLGGQQRTSAGVQLYASHATAIATDGVGNVYLAGDTDEPDFPTTAGAFLSGSGGTDTFYNTHFYSYVMNLSPAGKLIYSTLMGTGKSQCMGGSRCIGQQSTSETVSSLTADAGGAVTVSGIDSGSWNPGGGYVKRVAADGTKLLWAFNLQNTFGDVVNMFMAQDPSGAMNLFGRYVAVERFDVSIGPVLGMGGLFAAKLRADGSGLPFYTDLGESSDAVATGVVLDSSGNTWMAGTSSSPQFPTKAGVPNLGADFVLRLDAASANAQTLFRFPHGVVTAPPAMDPSGNLLLLEAQSTLLTFPSKYAFDSMAIVAFANAASFALNSGIYPGTLLTIYGFDLPASPQVSFNGAAAPVVYASTNQINVQVPFGLAQFPQVVTIQVTGPSGDVAVQGYQASSVGIFTVDGVHAAALNQDGSANSASNPAAQGSIVSLFGTGAFWPAETPDNTPAPSAMPLDQGGSGFEVVTNLGRLIPLNVLYFGAAPEIIQGVFQINVQLPQKSAAEADLQIKSVYFGDSNLVQVYVN